MLYHFSNLVAGLPMICFEAVLLEKLHENIRKKRFAILCILFAATYYLTNYIGQDRVWIRPAIEAGVMTAASLLFFHGDQKKKLTAAWKTWLWIQGLHLASWAILAILHSSLNSDQQGYIDIMLKQNVYNLLIYLIFIIAKIYSERKNRQKFIQLTFISCIFAVGQIIFYYYLFLTNPSGLTEQIIGIATICSAAILFVHGATLELMGKIVENQRLQNETERKMMEKKYEYDYYLLAQEQTEAIQKIRHDMWKQLNTVQQLLHGEEEARKEAEGILGKLEEEVNHIGRVYYCEDAVLNTILSLKQDKARKLGIEMNIKVDSTVKTEADDIDLCCIVTNLLDNAIESTEKVQAEQKETGYDDKEQRIKRKETETEAGDITKTEGKTGNVTDADNEISVSVGHRGGYLALKVENPMAAAPVKNKKGRYLSSKKETGKWKEHGRGLNIVEKTVEKYGGHLDIKIEERRFIATAFIQEKAKG